MAAAWSKRRFGEQYVIETSSGQHVTDYVASESAADLLAAAPELLAALKAVAFAESECVRDTRMPIWVDALNHVRAAIAKAEGAPLTNANDRP